MWANFDYSEKPLVKVNMVGKPENDIDFKSFLNSWLALQHKKENFTLIFDTTDVGWVHPKYAYRMVNFIKYLKTFEKQYLQKSIIIVKDNYTSFLLKVIFLFQSPVAPVFIVKDQKEVSSYYNVTEKSPMLIKNRN